MPSTNASPVTVEEFILETERQTGKVNYTKVVIQVGLTALMYKPFHDFFFIRFLYLCVQIGELQSQRNHACFEKIMKIIFKVV